MLHAIILGESTADSETAFFHDSDITGWIAHNTAAHGMETYTSHSLLHLLPIIKKRISRAALVVHILLSHRPRGLAVWTGVGRARSAGRLRAVRVAVARAVRRSRAAL